MPSIRQIQVPGILALWLIIRPVIPSAVSTGRLISPICLILLMQADIRFAFFAVAIVAAMSDWVDGALARRWNCATTFGAALDIVADKALCITLMILGIKVWGGYGVWWFWGPCLILLTYHVIVMSLRIFGKVRYGSSRIAKTKMLLEVTGLIVVFSSYGLGEALAPADWIGLLFIWTAAVLAVWSMLEYLGIVRDLPEELYPRQT